MGIKYYLCTNSDKFQTNQHLTVLLAPQSGAQPMDANEGGRDMPPITGAGICTTRDTLIVEGPTARNPPVVCGTLTGMHSELVIIQNTIKY